MKFEMFCHIPVGSPVCSMKPLIFLGQNDSNYFYTYWKQTTYISLHITHIQMHIHIQSQKNQRQMKLTTCYI